MRDLSEALSDLPAVRGQAPWLGHEYVKGWGVMALPFDSGHVLALRVFPENDFSPYRTVWHRDPAGRWSIHVDGQQLTTACPRYFGAACVYTGHSQIELTWTGPWTLQVTVDQPALEWTLTVRTTPVLTALNAVSRVLPLASWRPVPLLRARERVAGALGLGKLEMSGITPSGHYGTLMPEQMFFVDQAQAVLDGVDLGRPTRLAENPKIGEVPLPARGMLAIGQAMWMMQDSPTC